MPGLHNTEIHITRADPAKHDGREGFVWAVTWDDEYQGCRIVFETRGLAAVDAANYLDQTEAVR